MKIKAGFVCGEEIRIHLSIDNQSSKRLDNIQVFIQENVTLSVAPGIILSGMTQVFTQNLCSTKCTQICAPKSIFEWKNEPRSLIVPALVSSSPILNSTCKLGNVAYFVSLQVGAGSNVLKELCIPITIGEIYPNQHHGLR